MFYFTYQGLVLDADVIKDVSKNFLPTQQYINKVKAEYNLQSMLGFDERFQIAARSALRCLLAYHSNPVENVEFYDVM